MRIRCIVKNVDDVKIAKRKQLILDSGYSVKYEDDINLNQEYTVYGIWVLNNSFKYFICDSLYCECPTEVFPDFFEVIDSRLSRYWRLNSDLIMNKSASPDIVFKEWAENHNFYEDLIDGYDYAEKIFADYKEKMDLEFASSSMNDRANVLDKNWLMCPNCEEVWENKEYVDELIRCPNRHCKTIYLNSNIPKFIKD